MEGLLHTPRPELALLEPAAARSLAAGVNPDGHPWAAGYHPRVEPAVRRADRGGGRPAAPARALGSYQVIRRADGRVIGDVAFDGPPDAAGAVSVGCAISEDARMQGYATEALGALLGWAREQPGLTCVLADTTCSDLAAQRLLERVGMHRIGQDGELLYYML